MKRDCPFETASYYLLKVTDFASGNNLLFLSKFFYIFKQIL